MKVERAEATSADRELHMMRVCGYVDVALADVVEVFARPDIRQLLETTLWDVLRHEDGYELIVLRPAELERTTRDGARMALAWHALAKTGDMSAGKASIELITVQSGHDPKTEVLVTLWVTEDTVRPAADRMHRFLELLTDRISTAALR